MKLKFLLFSMLGAALFVGCNNEIDGPVGPVGPDGKPIVEGESTTATFLIKYNNPNTYAGAGSEAGTPSENAVGDIGMFIFSKAGVGESMAYITKTDYTNETQITLKCMSGEKLIYVATNIGENPVLLTTGAAGTTNTNLGNEYLGDFGWTSRPNVTFTDFNKQLWSIATTVVPPAITGVGTDSTSAIVVDNLIKAFTGFGNPAIGVISGENTNQSGNYFMSNWGYSGDSIKPQDINGIDDYNATCYFVLVPFINYQDSRSTTPDERNTNGKNALTINIQRAIAKVYVAQIDQTLVGNTAGNGSNAGKFIPQAKWALGNINNSEYPFQMWDWPALIVRSTRYEETQPYIADKAGWAKKLDNSRFVSGGQKYEEQDLTVTATLTGINSTKNLNFGTSVNAVSQCALVTENNNSKILNQYSTFVVFGGQYQPASYVTSVENMSGGTNAITTSSTFPTQWVHASGFGSEVAAPTLNGNTTDTMYYVKSFGANGMFFLGIEALKEYIYWIDLASDPTTRPDTLGLGADSLYRHVGVINKINALKATTGKEQADMQEYWHSYCYYRIWVADNDYNNANKYLVRRNHIYSITISKILGPGIGDPNDIIDPDPLDPEPIDEFETYVTATINVMKWHVVNQAKEVDLD